MAACKTASQYTEKDGLEFLALGAFGEERREETVLQACIALDAVGPKGKSIDGDLYMGWNAKPERMGSHMEYR